MMVAPRQAAACTAVLAALLALCPAGAAGQDGPCTAGSAWTLDPAVPFAVERDSARGDAGRGVGTIHGETVRLDDARTLRIENRGCTAYVVAYALTVPSHPPVAAERAPAEMAAALLAIAPWNRSSIDLPRIITLLGSTPLDLLLAIETRVSDNELGEVFLFGVERTRDAMVVRLTAVIGL